jgi:hypothetical protein
VSKIIALFSLLFIIFSPSNIALAEELVQIHFGALPDAVKKSLSGYVEEQRTTVFLLTMSNKINNQFLNCFVSQFLAIRNSFLAGNLIAKFSGEMFFECLKRNVMDSYP